MPPSTKLLLMCHLCLFIGLLLHHMYFCNELLCLSYDANFFLLFFCVLLNLLLHQNCSPAALIMYEHSQDELSTRFVQRTSFRISLDYITPPPNSQHTINLCKFHKSFLPYAIALQLQIAKGSKGSTQFVRISAQVLKE